MRRVSREEETRFHPLAAAQRLSDGGDTASRTEVSIAWLVDVNHVTTMLVFEFRASGQGAGGPPALGYCDVYGRTAPELSSSSIFSTVRWRKSQGKRPHLAACSHSQPPSNLCHAPLPALFLAASIVFCACYRTTSTLLWVKSRTTGSRQSG